MHKTLFTLGKLSIEFWLENWTVGFVLTAMRGPQDCGFHKVWVCCLPLVMTFEWGHSPSFWSPREKHYAKEG
jgi:hypothetical protein